MLTKSRFFYFVVFLSMLAFGAALKGGGNPSIPAGAKVYVAPMGGFETSVITSKAAMHDRVKTGHVGPSGTNLFYPAAGSAGKSVFVRQLRGPHFSRCPWCRRRSSMALTAAASPSNLPQSSTGRLEVTSVLARS